jgi:hypothetical protein
VKDTECDGGERGEREIEGSVWQKETQEDSMEMGGREIKGIGEAGRQKEICGEWQREIEGSWETEIDIARHEGKEKEIEKSGWHKAR